ncbi:MAG: HD domain-containing phosphohydrolase [Bacillota bacterium]
MANIIDKKENEQQLVLTKNKLFTTLYSIGDGVIVTDKEGKVTFMNMAAEEMTGWKFTEAENLDINMVFNIVDSHTGEPAYNPLYKVLEQGEIIGRSSDTTLISKERVIRQIIDTAAPILDSMNNITGALLVFSDITSEYKYKQELEDSKKLLQSALDSLSENIAVINKYGYITHVNKSWEDFARENGIENPEIVGIGVNYFSTVLLDDSVGDDARNFIADLKSIMSGTKKLATMEYPCHSPDEERWFIVRATPLNLGENDVINGAVISHENITARKKSENDLINEQRWLSTIFKNSSDAMVKVDSKLRIIDINKRFTELFEYKLADVKGLDPDDVLDKRESKLKAENRKLKKKFLAGKHVEMEGIRYTKSGDKKACLIRGIPVILSGEMVGGYGQYIDITERKKRVEKIRQMSYHDSLTGLYNRYYLEEELKRLQRSEIYPVSIIMFDLDGLKLINDSYGHHIGDLFLIELARLLKKELSDKATIGRWGGDEFLVILPGVKKTKDEMITEKITGDELEIDVANKDNPFISIAHGISVKEKLDQNIYDILHLAEDNMFKDKLLKEQSTKNRFVKLLLSALREKSEETETHALRMGELAKSLGKNIGLSNPELDKLSLLASLHDIGKMMIPDKILNKPEGLNSEEWKLIKRHPVIGYRICSSIDDFSHIANEVLSHHERGDGKGYPRGIQGKEIPIGARVLSIVDAYDVMTNGRPYKDPLSQEEALKEIELGAGSQFDPDLAEKFLEIMR